MFKSILIYGWNTMFPTENSWRYPFMYASYPKDFHEGQTGGQIAVFLLKDEFLMFATL